MGKLNSYLGEGIACECGRRHETDIEHILIQQGALKAIPSILKQHNFGSVFIVADENTYGAAGKVLEEILDAEGISYQTKCFHGQYLVPNEQAIGEILMSYTEDCPVIIGVGSGTINDLCKYISFKQGLPYIIVATAPSMDGFASTGAALIINHLKTTYETHTPFAIIGDLDILKQAPMEMIRAGIGDILGKYTCLADWKLSAIITEEYYCSRIVDIVEESIQQCVSSAWQDDLRGEETIAHIMEALILTGIAMSFVGNSRPASGAEHHLSHFWEMKALFRGEQPVLHGIKVGIGTLTVLKIAEFLSKVVPQYERILEERQQFNEREWQEKVLRAYEQAAEGVIALEKKTQKNNLVKHRARLSRIASQWQEIVDVLQKLPTAQAIEALLKHISAPVNPSQIGVDAQDTFDGIMFAKGLRDRYTVLQLAWDLNCMEVISEKMIDYFQLERG